MVDELPVVFGRRIGRPSVVDPHKLAYAAHLHDTIAATRVARSAPERRFHQTTPRTSSSYAMIAIAVARKPSFRCSEVAAHMTALIIQQQWG